MDRKLLLRNVAPVAAKKRKKEALVNVSSPLEWRLEKKWVLQLVEMPPFFAWSRGPSIPRTTGR
jgi:hypothetical protein